MFNRNLFSSIIALAIGSALTYTIIDDRSGDRSEDKVKILQENKLVKSIQILDKKKRGLNKTITDLEFKIDKLQLKYQHLQQADLTLDYSNKIVVDSLELEDELAENSSESLSQLEETYQKLEQHFNNNRDTDERSESFANELTELFYKQSDPFKNDLTELSCNRDICRVEIQFQSKEAESNLIQSIALTSESSAIQDFFMYNVPTQESDEELTHSVFFLSREGHQLPVHSR
ncbi:MAG: hypothetical protein V3U87_05255 [Methylococcaceae bacterium]